MTRLPALIALSLLLLGATILPTSASEEFVVRVTSSNPEMPLRFEAAWITFDGFHEIQYEEHTTPFEIRTVARSFHGMFRLQTGGSAELRVDVLTTEEESREVCPEGRGVGVTIVYGSTRGCNVYNH